MPFLFSIELYIMPASAPIGVNNAPKLEPIIEAYKPWYNALSPNVETRELNSALIGILFITFDAKKDNTPYLNVVKLSPIKLAK